ncbi:MAG TPA: PP2C family protein-serine/threonine phosphatase [Solirubrobacteraceae bacterium]|nr:PP2C family protein-serine/threonine phosphatase [Solirubrobacteraceae bacterium]
MLGPQLGARQVTIAVAIFDPGTGRLTYACAGHPPPLLPDGDFAPVTISSSPPVGAGAPTGRRQTTVALAPGERACFFTDGLCDAPVGAGERLGRDGVAGELEAIGPLGSAGDLVERIVNRSDGQPDDMAACILTAGPAAAAGWSLRIEELEVDAAMLRSGGCERFLLACRVGRAHVTRALREAREMVGLAGSAVLEVRVGEELVEVRVDPPPAVMLPIARRPANSSELAATG